MELAKIFETIFCKGGFIFAYKKVYWVKRLGGLMEQWDIKQMISPLCACFLMCNIEVAV